MGHKAVPLEQVDHIEVVADLAPSDIVDTLVAVAVDKPFFSSILILTALLPKQSLFPLLPISPLSHLAHPHSS